MPSSFSCTLPQAQPDPLISTFEVSHAVLVSIALVSMISCRSVVPNFFRLAPSALIGAVAPALTSNEPFEVGQIQPLPKAVS